MRKVLEVLQSIFTPRFNTVPALPMGNVPSYELSPHQADLDREFAGYRQQLTQGERDDLLVRLLTTATSGTPVFQLDIREGNESGLDAVTTELEKAGFIPPSLWRPREQDRVEGFGQDFSGEVENLEKVTTLGVAEDPNWKTHELASGKTVNDWVGEQTGPGAAFSKKIHNEFFATAWNWHRESAQNGKKNYHRHQRFFFLVGERVLNDDWTEIEQLVPRGFVIGCERDEMRVAVVVNDVSVQIDLTHIRAELDRRKSPWTKPRR